MAGNCHKAENRPLTSLRGLAALWVVGSHLAPPLAAHWTGWSWEATRAGYMGVDVFFVLSGFILAVVYEKLTLPGIPDFMIKRIFRVDPIIRKFGDEDGLMGVDDFSAARMAAGNYIDAMALIRLSAWAEVGSYDHVRFGWEGYELWCRFIERGIYGKHVPVMMAMYRVHGASMLRTTTDATNNKRRLIEDLRRRHPWVQDGVATDFT